MALIHPSEGGLTTGGASVAAGVCSHAAVVDVQKSIVINRAIPSAYPAKTPRRDAGWMPVSRRGVPPREATLEPRGRPREPRQRRFRTGRTRAWTPLSEKNANGSRPRQSRTTRGAAQDRASRWPVPALRTSGPMRRPGCPLILVSRFLAGYSRGAIALFRRRAGARV